MPIASEQVGASRQGRRIDDGIRRGQLVPGAQLGSGKGDRSIQIHDNACLGERDHPIRLVLADLSSEPLRQFELHDSRYQPLIPFGQLGSHAHTYGRRDQPLDPRRSINQTHQTRSERSRYPLALAPRARPTRSSVFGTGTSNTALPFGIKANSCPACQCWAVRTAFGSEIWNLADNLAVTLAGITVLRSIVDS